MTSSWSRIAAIQASRSGASSLEYAILAAVAVLAIMGAAATLAGDPADRMARQASAAAQGAEAPRFTARGASEPR